MLLLNLTGALFLLISLGLRSSPAIKDGVSAKPKYVRWITDRFARSLASKVGDDFAIIAVSGEKNDCQQAANVTAPSQRATLLRACAACPAPVAGSLPLFIHTSS